MLLRAGSARSCSSKGPLCRGAAAEESPSGARAWMRASLSSGQGWPVDKPRSRRATLICMDANQARHRGVLLFGYFLLDKQEKVTRPPLRGTKLAKSQLHSRGKRNASKSLDSRLRGNDEICCASRRAERLRVTGFPLPRE